jgi:hypothetical protein
MCNDFLFRLISEERVTFIRFVSLPGLEVLENTEDEI